MGFAVSGAQRQAVIVIAFGLRHDQTGLRETRLHRGRYPRNQSATGGRRHHDIGRQAKRRHVFGNFAARGALPGNDERIVIGPHQRSTSPGGDVVRNRFAVFLVAVIEHDLGAIALGALALRQRRVPGHHDGRMHIQDLGCRGHALGVVAGRERDHAATARGLRDRCELVEGAAKLERAGPLQHFRLQKNLGADAFVENRERQQGRPHRKGRHHPRSRIDIGSADRCHGGLIRHDSFVTCLPRRGQDAFR